MFIYVIPMTAKREKPKLPEKAHTPYFTLEENNWNDLGYVISFYLRFHSPNGKVVDIGRVKILHRTESKTQLPPRFKRLNEDFCSQGQTTEYYENLAKLGEGINNDVLEALNDIIFRPLLAEPFRSLEAFETSFLRDETAKDVFKNWKRYFDPKKSKEYDYQFSFICRLKGAQKPHQVGFDFRKKGDLPHRLMVLIGKNGTGKTQVLTGIAKSLTGRELRSQFKPKRPNYSRVFAVSYSLFDKFQWVEKGDSFGYIYCGLRTKDGYADDEQFVENLSTALRKVKELRRLPEWKAVVEPIIPYIGDRIGAKKSVKISDIQKLSSGQIMTLATLTDIVANIQPDSLLLFDEPETHLHPNAISTLIKAIYRLLDAFKSYAIISTHSPQVLQEVPSRSVQVFQREGNYPIVRPLGRESFGENLTTITHEVFEVTATDSFYKTLLAEMADKYTIEQILQQFSNGLGFNARVFLETISREKIRSNE